MPLDKDCDGRGLARGHRDPLELLLLRDRRALHLASGRPEDLLREELRNWLRRLARRRGAHARCTTRIAFVFFPVKSSPRIIPLIRRSTMFVFAFPKGLFEYRPPVCGITSAARVMD